MSDKVIKKADLEKAINEILLGIFKQLPIYSPIHTAISKPIIDLLKTVSVGGPVGDGQVNDQQEGPKL